MHSTERPPFRQRRLSYRLAGLGQAKRTQEFHETLV